MSDPCGSWIHVRFRVAGSISPPPRPPCPCRDLRLTLVTLVPLPLPLAGPVCILTLVTLVPPSPPQDLFVLADVDSDGTITLSEFKGVLFSAVRWSGRGAE